MATASRKPFSLAFGDPVARPLSISPLPVAITCGERWPANGLPEYVSAMPQYAIAQFGSSLRTFSKPVRDSWNQNECSSATDSLNLVLTDGLQEVSKLTVPISFGAIPDMSC